MTRIFHYKGYKSVPAGYFAYASLTRVKDAGRLVRRAHRDRA